MSNPDQHYPDGFDASCGMTPEVMQAANQLASSLTGKRDWDVPAIAAALTQGAGEAVEPVAEIVLFGRDPDLKEVAWRKGRMPKVGTKMYDAQQLQQAVARYRDEVLSLISQIDDGEQPAYHHCQEAIRSKGTHD